MAHTQFPVVHRQSTIIQKVSPFLLIFLYCTDKPSRKKQKQSIGKKILYHTKKKQDREVPFIKPEKSEWYINFKTFTYQLNCSSGFSFTIPPILVSYGNMRHRHKNITSSPPGSAARGLLSLTALPRTTFRGGGCISSVPTQSCNPQQGTPGRNCTYTPPRYCQQEVQRL